MKNQRGCLFVSLFIIGSVLTFEASAQVAAKHLTKPKIAAIPFISYNKSFGGIFGGFASLYFPISKVDTISPPSVGGVAGIYSTNKSWFLFGFSRLYFSKDLFRTVMAGGAGDQNFQYFSENYGVPGFINYSTLLRFFYVEQMIRVHGRLYTGVGFTYFNVATTFETGESSDEARNYLALGIPITFDTRDNVQNPSKGWFTNARLNRFDEAFGSAAEYTKLDLDASNYFPVNSTAVFASRASLSTALGSVPFEAQTIVGGKVLRGYSEGEYRGDQVYALQGEYRWNFIKKWGAVFFAGVATPVNKGESWSFGDILPAGGAGIRYMMIPDIRLNVGFDAAVGKGDYGLYFRIGEAF